jgi:OOP family OmpA-OmpF porin
MQLFSAGNDPAKGKKFKKKKYIKAANKAMQEGNIYASTDLYQQVLTNAPGTTSVLMNLANTYMQARDYENAEKYFGQALEADSVKNSVALYFKALMIKMQGRYNEAKPLFLQFIKVYKNEENAGTMRKWAKLEANGCKFALQEMKPNPNIMLTHLEHEVNSNYAEASPARVNDVLYYSSIKSDTVVNIKGIVDPELGHMKLFYSHVNEDSFSPSRIVEEVRDPNKHITNPSISSDGKKFFYTVCDGEFSGFICQIYMADYENGKIGAPHVLGPLINMPKTTNTQPYYSKTPSGPDVLYFVSNRPGGRGGMDIWYSVVNKKGEFSAPRNCGSKINTDRDEVSPFYDAPTNTLYFSSNGWISMGGLDIYKSSGEPGKNQIIENLGAPFNSSCDDFYYKFVGDAKNGYLVSNRPGIFSVRGKTCCDDIFSYHYKKLLHLAVKGRVVDAATDKIIPGATVNLALKGDSLKGGDLIIASDTATNYFFNLKEEKEYKLSIIKDGYFASTTEFNTIASKNSDTITVNVYMKKLQKNTEYRMGNIYYEYKKADLSDDAKRALDTLYDRLTENPTLIIEIGSHTDSRGPDYYNNELSQRRADICMNYLISKGLSKNRVTGKGYGKTMLLQDCSKIPGCPIGNTGDCECHQQNRRTVFKITGELDKKLIKDNTE